jgi:hypothetical protein
MIMRLQALSLVAAGAALSCQSVGAFTFSASHSAKHARFSLASSVNSDDAAFSSFASSLEQDAASPGVKFTSGNSKRKSTTPEATWKTDLDEILNPTTAQARRQILLSQLLTANADIRVSVEAALRDRKVRHLCHYLYQRSLLALLYTASFPFVYGPPVKYHLLIDCSNYSHPHLIPIPSFVFFTFLHYITLHYTIFTD